MEYQTIPLAEVLTEGLSEEERAVTDTLKEALQRFSCPQSRYHERFLREAAAEKSAHNVSRTYLIVDAEAIGHCLDGIDEHSRVIAAFFTVGISSLLLDGDAEEGLSRSKAKKIKKHQYPRDNTYGCFVIGELCRAENYAKDELPGSYILDECLSVIRSAQQIIGGRLVLVDSRRKVLDSLYAPSGFIELKPNGEKTEDGEDLITSFLVL